jgi:hypothetical protein
MELVLEVPENKRAEDSRGDSYQKPWNTGFDLGEY